MVGKIAAPSGLEPGTARSVGASASTEGILLEEVNSLITYTSTND